MFSVFNQILILFILLLLGYVLRRLQVVGDEGAKSLTTLILKATLPAMIIDSMTGVPFSPQALSQSAGVLVISFASYFALIALSFPFARLLGAKPAEAGVYRFSLVFSNVGFMGYPVVDMIFGKEAVFYTAIFNLPFNLLAFTIGLVVLTAGNDKGKVKLEWGHFVSPVVISIFIGFALFLTGFRLPEALAGSVKLLGGVTTPLSMAVIGMLLAKSSVRGVFGNFRLYVLGLFRLVLIPLASFFILRLFTHNLFLTAVPALIIAMPVAANTALLAEEHGASPELASQAVFITTLLSVFTIPLAAWFLNSFIPQ